MGNDDTIETLDAFDTRARAWIATTLPSLDDEPVDTRDLQHLLFDHGFAGIAFPKEYGGGGCTLQHQKVFCDAVADMHRQVPTTNHVSIGMLAPTILEHGSHEAKARFLPPLLRGDEVWIQLLSEPRGGSDMAGAVTRLTSDGDTYLVTGAKMWSTGAHLADYGLCLCRSDWDVPKHKGLSMIAVPLRNTAGVTIEQIRAADGTRGDFCQEFFDDVRVPRGNLIGEENQGWPVAQALLLHERNAVSNIGYGYLAGSARQASSALELSVPELVATATRRGVDDVLAGPLADAYIASVVGPLMSARISTGIRLGSHKGQWGSLTKLHNSVSAIETGRTTLAVNGPDAIVWDGDEVRIDNPGTAWLGIRGHTLAGGSNEMQRNIISERLLGLPREPSSERELPFSEVLRRASER